MCQEHLDLQDDGHGTSRSEAARSNAPHPGTWKEDEGKMALNDVGRKKRKRT